MKAEIYNYRYWVKQSDATYLKIEIEKLIKDSNFNILGFQENKFIPYGYSAVWLLAESHCAVHTFPESSSKRGAYIELSSCNKEKGILFNYLITDRFKRITRL